MQSVFVVVEAGGRQVSGVCSSLESAISTIKNTHHTLDPQPVWNHQQDRDKVILTDLFSDVQSIHFVQGITPAVGGEDRKEYSYYVAEYQLETGVGHL